MRKALMIRKIPAFIEDERAKAESVCQETGFPIRLPRRLVYEFRIPSTEWYRLLGPKSRNPGEGGNSVAVYRQ
jgi:hypothetical protein